MADEDNSGKLIWFIAGAAVGAGVALLFAPQTGEETRNLIADQAEKGRSAVADSSQNILERGRDMYERGRKLADDAADVFERGRKLAEGTIDSLRGKANA